MHFPISALRHRSTFRPHAISFVTLDQKGVRIEEDFAFMPAQCIIILLLVFSLPKAGHWVLDSLYFPSK
jgi:hypothetical protein